MKFTKLIVLICSAGLCLCEPSISSPPATAFTTTFISTKRYVDETAALICSKRKMAVTKFYRENDSPLPKSSYQINGTLFIPHVSFSDEGTYICEFKTKEGQKRKKIFLSVLNRNISVATTTNLPFRTKIIETTTVQNLDSNTCSNDTLLNGLCPGSASLFECHDGQKINRSFRCNRKKDCSDGSDEYECEFWPPKITRLPDPLSELYCGSQTDDQTDMLKLECEFVGHPEPLIKWKKYEGHVPSKCRQISNNGKGILLCPNFEQSDQGAYSCIAQNSVGSSESQPKSLAKCKNLIPCNGFRVRNKDNIEHCLECYCSGKTNKCQNIKSKPMVTTIKFPDTIIELDSEKDGNIVQIQSGISTLFSNKISAKIKYCQLKSDALGENSLLKSYGRNIRVPRYSGKVGFSPNSPDLIIQGNGISIFYNFRPLSLSSNTIDIRFWPGNWHHSNGTIASRDDIMSVLSNVDQILFRCEFIKGNVENWSDGQYIHLESSSLIDTSDFVSYVEKCNCPKGYIGLSCESCAAGHRRIPQNFGFICEEIRCDEKNGYILSGNDCVKSPCDINGSLSLITEPDGKCLCKENMTGPTCNQTVSCDRGYFRVEKSNECVQCWCNGVTDQCNSSSLYRTEISSITLGGYNSSNGKNFWLLPPIFSGNKLASYGGHIKYALKYITGIPKQKSVLTVVLLTVNEVTLSFTHANVDNSILGIEKVFVVPLIEKYWEKSDKTAVNRSEFLTALTKLKAVYVESPYHLSSGKVNLTWVRMSDSKKLELASDKLAYEVEQCLCPRGYTGLSCESCDVGYYKEKNSNLCVECNCDHCDPVEGCLSCPKGYYRDNPSAEIKPHCIPCDCNGREIKCGKDSNNSTYCLCQAGFVGLKCENLIPTAQNSSHLTLRISPSKISNNVVGAEKIFNCSYSSGEKLHLSLMKVYGTKREGPFTGILYPKANSSNGFESSMSLSVVLEEGLTDVECLVHNGIGKEIGRVVATIESKGTERVKITNCYSDYVFVKETKSKDLICWTTGFPKPIITWYMKTPLGSSEKIESVDGVHSIENVSLSQNGTLYICEAENSIGDKDICTITLVVERNCDTLHIEPKSLVVKEGENIYLQCSTTFNNSVTWSGPKIFLPFFRTFKSDGNLTITEATIEDSGNYTCSVKSSDGQVIEKSVWVNVTEILIPPSITITSNDVELEYGSNFRVSCLAIGKPPPTITWREISGQKTENVLFDGHDLIIKSAVLENTGIYECEAVSSYGRDLRRIFIKVTDNLESPKLEVTQSSLEIIEGHSGQLECKILEGNPKPSIEWMKDVNGLFEFYQAGPILRFQNASRYDTGIYQCVGRNPVGQDAVYSEINVMFVPEINVSTNLINVIQNEEITVSCSAVGNPIPKLTWINQMKGKKRHTGDNEVLASLILNAPEIKITIKATPDLYGLVCIASNKAGESRETVSVKVFPQLIVEEQDVHKVFIGSHHELICKGCSGKLQWEKLKGPLVGDECEIPNGLMISSVQIQHNDTYVCKCSTDPSFKKMFGIIVAGFVPKFTRDPKSYIVLPAVLKSVNATVIEMSFMTKHNQGLLLKDEYNQLILYIQDSRLILLLNLDNEKKHHFLSNIDLEHDAWYSLKLDISFSYVKMILFDSKSRILEEKVDHLKNIDGFWFSMPLSNFFVGGTKHKPKNPFVHHKLLHVPSLEGCISRLVIDDQPYNLIEDGSYSMSVSLCKRCSEPINPCMEEGKCLDAPTQLGFVCICPEFLRSENYNCPSGCFGMNCDTQSDLCDILNPCNRKDLNVCTNKISSLSCSCALGFEGLTCEKEKRSSFCVRGNGYVKLPSKHFYSPSLMQPEVVEMQFKLNKPKGLLLWRGNTENYMALSVNKGQVHFIYVNQGVELKVIAIREVSLMNNHFLIAKRMNDSIVLQIDSEVYSDQSKFTTSRVTGDVYLGGVPDGITPDTFKYSGLNGCIHAVSFGGQTDINFDEDALEAVNVNVRESHSATNKLRNSLIYDRAESDSEDDDHDSDYNTSS